MSRKKILIVDDSPVIAKTMSLTLNANGYDVLTAEDGASAAGAVRREKPDLILLDISFPPDVGHGGGISWDGFLILDWVRRLEEAKNIPFIVVTGGSPAKYQERALAAGAVAFFQKPVNKDELLTTIRQILPEESGGEEPVA
ncbi:MAG: two-component system, OmpR family, operon response regulator KdpE [Verrucomicrobiota bacterium]